MKERAQWRRWSARILFAMLCFALICSGNALASRSSILYANDAEGIEIHRAQEKLKQLGYLDNTTYQLDMNMRYALQLFCENNGLTYEDRGISREIWDVLMGDGELIAYEQENPFIPFGEVSERVAQLQIRLKDLGYLGEGTLEVSHFDEVTQRGVELFCKMNSVAYDGSGISKSLQTLIFSDAAVAYVEQKQNPIALLRGYMLNFVVVGNVRVPNLLWMGAAYLALYLATVGLTLLLFNGKSGAKEISSDIIVTRDTPQAENAGSFIVDLKIIYGGKVREKRCNIRRDFTIGRSNCALKLDKADRKVSKCHCTLRFQNGSLYLSDNSRNGTYINERFVHHKTTEVNNGDRLRVGEHMLIVRY